MIGQNRKDSDERGPSGYRPLLDFMIVGAQKCGTTALFHYLTEHPEICMASEKEPHVFDDPDYCRDWTPERVDERYRPYFQHCPHDVDSCRDTSGPSPATPGEKSALPPEQSNARCLRGEATPIYLFLPEIAGQLKRYNPALRLIVLLRDPVARAVSQYHMERNRGYEQLPLPLALLAEPWRLWRCADPRRHGSAWRRHSYRRRSLYSLQLHNLCRHFDARQILLVRTEDLALRHDMTLRRVFRFLGVSEQRGIEAKTVFAGDWGARPGALASLLLRVSLLPEMMRMRKFWESSMSVDRTPFVPAA